MGSIEERRCRRQVRRAMQTRDINILHLLLNGGATDLLNKPLSDVHAETPLTFAIKHGYLEIVELLLSANGSKNVGNVLPQSKCKQTGHSPLDVAIKSWLDCLTVAPEDNASLSRRYRILRLVLTTADYPISQGLLSSLVDRTVADDNSDCVSRLVTVVCNHGHTSIRSQLLVALVPFCGSVADLSALLISGADATVYSTASVSTPCIPLQNSVLLVRACNDAKLLARIEAHTRPYVKHTDENTVRSYQFLLRLLVVCGHRLQLGLLNQLYTSQVRMYKWIHVYTTSSPPPLANLSRITLRRRLQPNVLHACAKWTSLPEAIRDFITFKCWMNIDSK